MNGVSIRAHQSRIAGHYKISLIEHETAQRSRENKSNIDGGKIGTYAKNETDEA